MYLSLVGPGIAASKFHVRSLSLTSTNFEHKVIKEKNPKKDKKDKKNKKENTSKKSKSECQNKIPTDTEDAKTIESVELNKLVLALREESKDTTNRVIQIECAISKFVEMYKKIIATSPYLSSYQRLVENKAELDLDMVPALSRYMVKFAAELETLSLFDKRPVLKKLESYDTLSDVKDTNSNLPGIPTGAVETLKKVPEVEVKKVNKSSQKKQTEQGTSQRSVSSWPPPIPEIKDPAIRARVFTHRSLVNAQNLSTKMAKVNLHNEKLEFFGDAALYFAVTRIIYRQFPHLNEGQLTTLRTQLVNNKRLKLFSSAYGLKERLKCSDDFLKGATYAGSKNKIDADAFEAYIGGLVEDNPHNCGEVIENWLEALMNPTIQELTTSSIKLQQPEMTNPAAKTQLYSLIGYIGSGLCYRVVKRNKSTDRIVVVECIIGDGTVLGVGKGKTEKIASSNAAENVLANKPLVEEYVNKKLATTSRFVSAPNKSQYTKPYNLIKLSVNGSNILECR